MTIKKTTKATTKPAGPQLKGVLLNMPEAWVTRLDEIATYRHQSRHELILDQLRPLIIGNEQGQVNFGVIKR